MKAYRYFLLLFFAVAFGSAHAAQTNTPFSLLKQVGDKLFVDIAEVDAQGDDKKAKLKEVVKTRLIPHIDTKFVSFKLLGKHVREINKGQALAFIDAVESYLTVTYADALMSYKGQEVRFIKPNGHGDNGYASVKTEIVEPGKPTIDIVFKLRRDKSGTWRVYDLVAEGISLLNAKQKEIIARISEVGIDQVNQELSAKS